MTEIEAKTKYLVVYNLMFRPGETVRESRAIMRRSALWTVRWAWFGFWQSFTKNAENAHEMEAAGDFSAGIYIEQDMGRRLSVCTDTREVE